MKDFFKSFYYAARGIISSVKSERNLRFHLCVMFAVIFFSRFYALSRAEYALLFIVFAFVISAEIINTAIENAVDFTSEEKSPLAEKAKDAAAGAVLVSAVGSVFAGIFLFWDAEVFKKIYEYFAENIFRPIILISYIAASAVFVFLPEKKGK